MAESIIERFSKRIRKLESRPVANPLPNYTTAGRPAATSVPAGYGIYNTTTGIPNYSTGLIWQDAAGNPV